MTSRLRLMARSHGPGRAITVNPPGELLPQREPVIYEHAYLRINAENQSAFEQAAPDARQILLSAQGCREVLISKSVDEPGLYLLRVGWDSIDDHLERFPVSEQGAALSKLIGGLFADQPVVKHFHDKDLSA